MAILENNIIQLPPYAGFAHLANATYLQKRKYFCANQRYPRLLFKYKPINEQHLYDYIVASKLYLSSREQLNDPFDVQSTLIFPNNAQSRINYLKRISKENHLTHQERKRLSERLSSPAKIKLELEKSYTKELNLTGFHSFALSPTNLLMWSHYSQSHSGICLVFDTARDIDLFVRSLPVTYSSNFPIVDFSKEIKKDFIKDVFLTKADAWKYEDERRIFERNGAKKYLAFEPKALSGIILGCNIKDESIDSIKKLLEERKKKNQNEIKIYQAIKANSAFNVKIKSIKLF